MRSLIIHTEKYRDAAARFFPEGSEQVLGGGRRGGAEYICVRNRRVARMRLQKLLEYIIINDNPALAGGEHVFSRVAELAFDPTRAAMQERLDEFLREGGVINIDGYVSFRMGEYAGKINAILYSIIKKNLYKS